MKQKRHYKDAHRIYHDLTGKRIDSIEHLEVALINDFRSFRNVYDTIEVNKKNFLNVQYVLFNLLKKLGHPCDKKNFNLPKGDVSRRFHDMICKKVFDKLVGKLSLQ